MAAASGFAAIMAGDEAIHSAFAGLLKANPRDGGSAAKLSDDDVAILLARTTLLALHNANLTGEYGVFRKLAAPPFQQANSAERLAAAFAAHRARPFDLSIAALKRPMWTLPPTVGADNLLRLSGFYSGGTENLRFALAFEPVDSTWRLHEIHVSTEPAMAASTLAAAPR